MKYSPGDVTWLVTQELKYFSDDVTAVSSSFGSDRSSGKYFNSWSDLSREIEWHHYENITICDMIYHVICHAINHMIFFREDTMVAIYNGHGKWWIWWTRLMMVILDKISDGHSFHGFWWLWCSWYVMVMLIMVCDDHEPYLPWPSQTITTWLLQMMTIMTIGNHDNYDH